jgi:hypothetical protein
MECYNFIPTCITLLFFHFLSSLPLSSLPLPSLPFSKPNHMGNGIQPVVAPSNKVGKKKRKLVKNSLDWIWVKPQRAFLYLNNIDRAKQNIVKMIISCSHDALCDDHMTFMQYPCDRSAKIKKSKKMKKHVFLSFLHVSNWIHVRNRV